MPPERTPQSWIQQHARSKRKPADYAEKTLAAYKLGMRAKGAIIGVRVLAAPDSCPECRALGDQVYSPDDAPRLPHAACTHAEGCRCAYTPVMRSHEHLAALIHSDTQPGGEAARPH
jgi:hypothetical protein